MFHELGPVLLRPIEQYDLNSLYLQKNDTEIANMLGGFSKGYSKKDIENWWEYHRQRTDEVLWAIIEKESNHCIGHVGLYQIDFRIRKAEFAIMIGDKQFWHQGIGSLCTRYMIQYGFNELNLNRIQLSVLESNQIAVNLYKKLGFRYEGKLRQAQFKNGHYHDVIIMSILREESENG